MAIVITVQSTENMEYVRRLLKQKQPGFAAALELAVDLVEWELTETQPARVHEGSIGNCLYGGFATADRERVMVAAFTRRSQEPRCHGRLHKPTSRPGSHH